MSSINISNYQKSDWKQLLEMVYQTMDYHMSIQNPVRFESYTDGLISNYCRSIVAKHRLKKGKLLVAHLDNKLVGFIYGYIDHQDKEMKKSAVKSGTISELFVQQEARGKKVGKLLMAEIEKYMVDHSCRLIRLSEVHQTNNSARKFYQYLGYQPRTIEYAKRVN